MSDNEQLFFSVNVLEKLALRGISQAMVEEAFYNLMLAEKCTNPKHVPPKTWMMLGITDDEHGMERVLEFYVIPRGELLVVRTAFWYEGD